MRTKGSRAQVDALRNAPLERVFEGLNALRRLRWAVNRDVLNVVQDAWDANRHRRTAQPIRHPTSSAADAGGNRKGPGSRREHAFKTKRDQMKNHDLHSLRCDAKNKLSIAHNLPRMKSIFRIIWTFVESVPHPTKLESPRFRHVPRHAYGATNHAIHSSSKLRSATPDLLVRPPARLFLMAEFSLIHHHHHHHRRHHPETFTLVL